MRLSAAQRTRAWSQLGGADIYDPVTINHHYVRFRVNDAAGPSVDLRGHFWKTGDAAKLTGATPDAAANDSVSPIADGHVGVAAYVDLAAGYVELVHLSWGTGSDPAPLPPTGVTITDSGDEIHYAGETGVPITGSGFGASQGSGKVYLSPTNDYTDGGRVEQTVTSWGNTAIAFTLVKGGLSFDTNVYLFVVDNAGVASNGWVVQIQTRPRVTETLINETSAPVASVTGMTMVVYHSVPTTATPNPAQVIEGVASDGSGVISVILNRGSLANAPVWIGLMKAGSPSKGTMRQVTPAYI